MLKLLTIALLLQTTSARFRVIREWNYLNFTWNDPEHYRTAIQDKVYIPENQIIAGLKYFNGFYYVTLPRMKHGVPATLGRIPAGATNDTGPLIQPFPSWEWNKVDDCDALQNVQNVEVDLNGQIWIIDGGRTGTITENPANKCQPKLVVYDVGKMEKIFSYTFPENVASSNGSFLYDIVLDKTDEGFAYITDNGGRDPGIIVFSLKTHTSWKHRHPSMHSDPYAGFFKVNDIAISAPLNIASIALGPRLQTSNGSISISEDREVYYSPISSLHLYSVKSSLLRRENSTLEIQDHGLKSSQSVGMIMDNKGVMYYSLLSSNSVAKWNTSDSFQTGQKIIAKDPRYLEWVNSFTFNDKGNLTLLVNRLNRFIFNEVNISEPNFHLITSHVEGQSYLNDGYLNYITITPTTTSTTEKAIPGLKPGTDQDPYLAPEPQSTEAPSSSTAVKVGLVALVSLVFMV